MRFAFYTKEDAKKMHEFYEKNYEKIKEGRRRLEKAKYSRDKLIPMEFDKNKQRSALADKEKRTRRSELKPDCEFCEFADGIYGRQAGCEKYKYTELNTGKPEGVLFPAQEDDGLYYYKCPEFSALEYNFDGDFFKKALNFIHKNKIVSEESLKNELNLSEESLEYLTKQLNRRKLIYEKNGEIELSNDGRIYLNAENAHL
jgi:hypothetical protein